jgi:hypothetical protein
MPCTNNVPKIDILLGGYWLEVSPKDYLVPVSKDSDVCFICIYPDYAGRDQWLLGDAFLRGFYSVYNYENYKFGFAPVKGSTKAAPRAENTGEDSQPDGIEWYYVLILIIAIICIVLVLYFVLKQSAYTAPELGIKVKNYDKINVIYL